ncbi:hypothetical protein PFISCL1PPCAC_28578 [Pristionchus fissidentatus]|uniref:Uncharacterized protein n=1 Tax=Pristionchus fissidentatus TaxID=1538716 RepID=A0AAV5X1G8_9BILA|nr:hypothetical protein PFISCL1PPCAC_1991 [Pristionchus fissidentatus]GMT37281.1 hypothetical protein PFISCL1PPCAC_28578 [Pristionchus fissidentatus]
MKYRLLLFALLTGCAAQEIYMMSSEWSRWSPWSFCSGGVRVRVRACATVRGFKCMGHNKEFQSCDLAATTSSPSEGKNIDDPFVEDRSMAMKQLYPDYDQPFKPQAAKVATTEAPFFKNNNLLERLRENDSLASLINRAATVSPPSTVSPSSPPPPILASEEEYEDEEDEETTTVTSTTTTTTAAPTTVPSTTRHLPEIRVATVTTKPATKATQLLHRKRPVESTTEPSKKKEELESLEHGEEEEEEETSEYEEPTEGDEGGEKREKNEKEEKSRERNKIVAAASKIVSDKERIRSEDEEKEVERRRENERREKLPHKVDGGDDDINLSSPVIKRKDLQSQSSQINHIPVKMSSTDPFEEENSLHSKLLGVEAEMRNAESKSRRDLEFTLKNVNGIIEKLEYEARFRATQNGGLTPLQHSYLKRSRDIRGQLVILLEKSKKPTTTTRKIPATQTRSTTTTTTTATTRAPATPPEPLNPKIAEDTVRALDWLMENINDRLVPEGESTVTVPTTTKRPRKVHCVKQKKLTEVVSIRNRTRRPSYMKGVRFIENGEEIHPNPIRLRTHSIPSQRSYRLPSSSIRTFESDTVDGKTDHEVKEPEIEPVPLLTPTQPGTLLFTFNPLPSTLLPSQKGIEPIIGTDWEPFEWSDWSDWSECICGWQLRKRICIPNSEEVQCPSPEYQRRKCKGGTCRQKAARH